VKPCKSGTDQKVENLVHITFPIPYIFFSYLPSATFYDALIGSPPATPHCEFSTSPCAFPSAGNTFRCYSCSTASKNTCISYFSSHLYLTNQIKYATQGRESIEFHENCTDCCQTPYLMIALLKSFSPDPHPLGFGRGWGMQFILRIWSKVTFCEYI